MEQHKNMEKKLYELLPDYIFGKLSNEDKEFFESNYLNFPELVKEVDEGKKFFARLDSMDFNRIFKEQTRNVSVRVHNKRERKSKFSSFLKVSKVVMPTMGVAAILLIAWNIFFAPADRIVEINQQQLSYLDKPVFSDFSTDDDLLDNSLSGAILSQNPYSNSFGTIYEFVEDMFDDDYDETLELAYNESPEYFWGFGMNNNLSIINEVSNLTESEFQELLEELSNNETNNY